MLFITSNKNKFLEAQEIIPHLEQHSLDLEEIQSLDIKEIVLHKLQQAYEVVQKPCIVEDVSFEIASLNGLPGPFIKYFAKALGEEGIARLCNTSKAVAICCVGYHDGITEHIFVGKAHGTITAPRGQGFGFDVIFVPEGETQTTAELGSEYKNNYSHRAGALKQLAEHLNT